ncbi:class I SAM-dependent methyltransferase [Methylocystis sp.]|uniref:class I SAM-dependent methyltransferase n=1 Tax=Methylocystis sp. TaxID=1911079 RepID=UPI003D10DF99
MSNDNRDSNPPYVLGHSDHELNRLRAQARFLEPVTRQFLREAGIAQGMRVLDVGSGAGDVAFLAAELVGETGMVMGIDKAPAAVSAATAAAQQRGLRNVQFREGDPAEIKFDRRFQAVIGRYVLPFQADPSAMLRGLARHLVQGGLLVFHEPDWTFVRSFPLAPLYERACRWIIDTTELSGQSWNFLDRARFVFTEADLPPPTMRLHTFVAGDSNAREWLMGVGDIVESLLPTMVKMGVATAEEVNIESFRDRLLQEARSNGSVIVGRSEVGMWTNA